MTPALERFLRYVAFDTRSSEKTGAHPSTPGQLAFGAALADELRALGARDVRTTPSGYVYATVPASAGREGEPALGFIAHLDTSPDASGAGVRPRVVRYEGGVLPLGDSRRSLDPALLPELDRLVGRTLVVTDGTTLLGADDKAGVAAIVSAAAVLLAPDAPSHGEVRIAFTPDEEIGEGTLGFDPETFGARAAYTVDGDDPAVVDVANFNAAEAVFTIRGVSVHPGSAKGVMRNAVRVAAEILAALPADECPERTSGREGFFHPDELSGSVASARLRILVRDHDAANFARRKEELAFIARDLCAKYGEGAVELALRDQYANMEEPLRKRPDVVRAALDAIASVGLEPRLGVVRGGTDGARLSCAGLPCPNLGAGGRAFHGEREFLVVEEFDASLRILLALACGTAART